MARPKDKADITPVMKGGLKRALLLMEKATEGNKPISEVWLKLFRDTPIEAMRMAISMTTKELDVTNTTITPEKWLELMANAGKPESTDSEDSIPGSVH